MAKIATIPITNVYMGGDYTGQILVGPHSLPMNVILDTGSSALALDASKYKPDVGGGDKTTNLAQAESYAEGSNWTGAVIQTQVAVGVGTQPIVLQPANVAIAYSASASIFGAADGILGLAYAPLDDAFSMPDNTWQNQYSLVQVRTGRRTAVQPYLTQLAAAGVTTDIISFLTRRSFVHVGGKGVDDPLNNGLMILGGGEESTNLYTGAFQTVKVVSDEWYCTNLKSIVVGKSDPVAIGSAGPKGMPSNSIVDSGTNSLILGPEMLDAVVSKFSPANQRLLNNSMYRGQLVSAADLDLAHWPTLRLVLEGDKGDVSLDVISSNYWQVNTQSLGAARVAIAPGQSGLAILGLPLMNGYFTIFDGEADSGRGVVKFARRAE